MRWILVEPNICCMSDYNSRRVSSGLTPVSCMKKDSPPPHRGGEIVRGLPCVKKLNQGGVKLAFLTDPHLPRLPPPGISEERGKF